MEVSWSCWNLKKGVKTNGFSIFFKLQAVCFKWLQVGSSWSQVGHKLASSWLKLASNWLKLASSWPKMASCCLELAQVGLKLAQVGSKLSQVGSKISSGSLQETLLEGSGRVQAGSWEALGANMPSWRPQRCQNDFQVTPESTKNQ